MKKENKVVGHLCLYENEYDALMRDGFVKIDDEERGEMSVSVVKSFFEKVSPKDGVEGMRIRINVLRSGSAVTKEVDE